MIMFCGLPVIVAALPTLEASGMASRYGIGSRLSLETRSSTSGVMARQIVSLTRKAESEPVTRTIATNNTNGWWARVTTQLFTSRKKPDRRRLATTIIMPSRSVIVSKSIARYASSSETTPKAIIRLAPSSAAPARSS